MTPFYLIAIAGVLTAMAAALVGALLLVRKMVLVADSMPHIALPGIALGVVYHFNPMIGAMAFLFLAVLVIWFVEYKTFLPPESIIGVLFISSLAVGAAILPEEGLLEAFFGSIEKISSVDALIQIAVSLIVIGLVYYNRKILVLSSIAPELAESARINTKMVELFFLLLVALTVALGINFVGVLLMSALLIFPTVSARNLTFRFSDFLIVSTLIGGGVLFAGLLLSQKFSMAPGILTVFVGAGVFVLSLAYAIIAKKE